MNHKIRETIITIAALAAYGTVFLCLVGTVLFLLFGLLAVWSFFWEILI